MRACAGGAGVWDISETNASMAICALVEREANFWAVTQKLCRSHTPAPCESKPFLIPLLHEGKFAAVKESPPRQHPLLDVHVKFVYITPMYQNHYHERYSSSLAKLFKRRDVGDLKIDLWNAFVDSGLTCICEDDCSALPRILPVSYLPVITRSARGISLFMMKLLSLPRRELVSILPSTPVTDYLINELEVLKYHPGRLTGSMRFDMAVIGPAGRTNPPKLFEINEIGFDGTGRSSYIQETILKLFPELERRVVSLDTAESEVRNMRRLGKKMVRFQYDGFCWDEEVIMSKARKVGLDIKIFSPTDFKVKIHKDYADLKKTDVKIRAGKIFVEKGRVKPDALQVAYSFELKDYKEAPNFFRKLIRSKTPLYGPFVTGLIASKATLTLLEDKSLRRRLAPGYEDVIKNSLLGSRLFSDCGKEVKSSPQDFVLKHADGMGGELVYVGKEICKKLKVIPERHEGGWIVQNKVNINTIDVNGFLSRPRRVIADLGAFIQYDWNGSKFTNFNVGGFITRATNRSKKVNVSGGGIQVPVFFNRSV